MTLMPGGQLASWRVRVLLRGLRNVWSCASSNARAVVSSLRLATRARGAAHATRADDFPYGTRNELYLRPGAAQVQKVQPSAAPGPGAGRLDAGL